MRLVRPELRQCLYDGPVTRFGEGSRALVRAMAIADHRMPKPARRVDPVGTPSAYSDGWIEYHKAIVRRPVKAAAATACSS